MWRFSWLCSSSIGTNWAVCARLLGTIAYSLMCLCAVAAIQAVSSTCVHIYFVELWYDFLFVELRYDRQSVARHTWRTDSKLLWCYRLWGSYYGCICSFFTHMKLFECMWARWYAAKPFFTKKSCTRLYVHIYICIRIVWICVHVPGYVWLVPCCLTPGFLIHKLKTSTDHLVTFRLSSLSV